jgi:hypothetical protein
MGVEAKERRPVSGAECSDAFEADVLSGVRGIGGRLALDTPFIVVCNNTLSFAARKGKVVRWAAAPPPNR